MRLRLFFAILLICAASYASISSLSLSSTVDPGGTTEMTAKMLFDSNSGKAVSFYVSGNVTSVTAYDASGLLLPATPTEFGNYTMVTFIVPSDYVELDIQTPYLTSKYGSEWRYDSSIRVSENVSNFTAVLQLPPDAKISSTNGAVEGDSSGLALYWSAIGFMTSDKATMRVSYSLGQETMPPDWQYLAIAVVVLVVAVALYLYSSRKPPKPEAAQPSPKPEESKLESNAVFKTLDENDKEILREIAKQGGKTTQAHLYLYTHIPKATLSRRLASLESRGIVARSQKGNRNLVTLGELGK